MPLSLKNLLLSFLKNSDVISSVETFLVVKRMGIVIGKVDGFGMFFYFLWVTTRKLSIPNFVAPPINVGIIFRSCIAFV